jgi:hypothetical protein
VTERWRKLFLSAQILMEILSEGQRSCNRGKWRNVLAQIAFEKIAAKSGAKLVHECRAKE